MVSATLALFVQSVDLVVPGVQHRVNTAQRENSLPTMGPIDLGMKSALIVVQVVIHPWLELMNAPSVRLIRSTSMLRQVAAHSVSQVNLLSELS